MRCDRARTRITEMTAAECRNPDPDLQAHLDSCPSCAEAYELRKIATESLGAAAGGVRAGDAFERRVLDAIDREPAGPGPSRGRAGSSWRALLRPGPAWAAVALVLAALSGFNYLRTLGYFVPRAEVPASMGTFIDDVGHDAYLYSRQAQTLELLTGSPDEVSAWFSTRLDFAVIVPDRLAGGYELEGVRLWHTVSRLSALVRYRDAEGPPLFLFVVSATNLADRGGRTIRREGRRYRVGESFQYDVAAWREGGRAYALVGRLAPDELAELAAGFRP